MISSLPNLLEGLAFSGFVALYIWRMQEASPRSWLVFPVWRVAPVFLFFMLTIGIAGLFLGALHRLPAHFLQPKRFAGYFAFCLLQQVGLQSITMNRLLQAFRSREMAAFTGGLLFGALHWPNPVLVPLTFIGGVVMCWLFARERNILPLVLGQALIGALVWWAFPLAWHHSMRVGPGYYTYVPR